MAGAALILWGLLNVLALLVACHPGALLFEASLRLRPSEAFTELRALEHDDVSCVVNVSREPIGVPTDAASACDIRSMQDPPFSQLVLEVAPRPVARQFGVLDAVSQLISFGLDLATLRADSFRVSHLGPVPIKLALCAE